MSVCVCMHACISLSCDWLNDFLKGYRATISFWHLITVRSQCAPADPLWYGPCTCPSPLSQVPIIIIKPPTPPPPPPPAPTPSPPQPLRAHGGFTAVVLSKRREFNLPPVLAEQPYSSTRAKASWQSYSPSPSKPSSKYSSEQKIIWPSLKTSTANSSFIVTWSIYQACMILHWSSSLLQEHRDSRNWWCWKAELSPLMHPKHISQLVWGFERVTWQRSPISKGQAVKSEPGFQIICSDWLGLTLPFSEMNYQLYCSPQWTGQC